MVSGYAVACGRGTATELDAGTSLVLSDAAAGDTDLQLPPADASGQAPPADASDSASLQLPPGDAGFDYQLGGAYPPPDGVRIVVRDRGATPAPGLYNVCYVNGFQTQPDEESFWDEQHPELLLKDASGDPVVDEDWGEILLDTGSDAKRRALASIVGEWIEGCARSGFDAVEVDNLDSYDRSDSALSEDDNVAFMALLAEIAHDHHLAIAQKNAAELLPRAAEMDSDFAVVEQCNRWNECADYVEVYDDLVFIVEYRAEDFERGCDEFPDLSIVLRDLDVSPEGAASYVYDGC